jgi:hypothetical protein
VDDYRVGNWRIQIERIYVRSLPACINLKINMPLICFSFNWQRTCGSIDACLDNDGDFIRTPVLRLGLSNRSRARS